MNIQFRPEVYLPSMTEDEVIAYAETYAATDLEKRLLELLIESDEAYRQSVGAREETGCEGCKGCVDCCKGCDDEVRDFARDAQ